MARRGEFVGLEGREFTCCYPEHGAGDPIRRRFRFVRFSRTKSDRIYVKQLSRDGILQNLGDPEIPWLYAKITSLVLEEE
jgi:hypothetical protein